MSKVLINAATPIGNMVLAAVQKILEAKELLDRAQAASAVAQASPNGSPLGSTALEGSTYGFGGASGQGPDYASALQTLQTALASFVTTQSGAIGTLENGNVS